MAKVDKIGEDIHKFCRIEINELRKQSDEQRNQIEEIWNILSSKFHN